MGAHSEGRTTNARARPSAWTIHPQLPGLARQHLHQWQFLSSRHPSHSLGTCGLHLAPPLLQSRASMDGCHPDMTLHMTRYKDIDNEVWLNGPFVNSGEH